MEESLISIVKKLANTTSAYAPSFSPDGRELVFISDLNGIPQLWRISIDGGWPHLVTSFEDPIFMTEWSPKDRNIIAFSSAPGGGMNQQVYLINPFGKNLIRLTNGGKETNWLDGFSKNGDFLLIASNIENSKSMDNGLYNISKNEYNIIVKNQGVGILGDMTNNHDFGIISRVQNRSDNNLYLVDLRTKEEYLLTPHEGYGTFRAPVFSKAENIIYLISDGDRDHTALAKIHLSSSTEVQPLKYIAMRENTSLSSYIVSDNRKLAILNWNFGGRSQLELFDLETERKIENIEIPHEIVSDMKFSHDAKKLALVLTGSSSPQSIFIYDFDKKILRQLTFPSHPGIDLEKLIRPELVKFNSFDGLELSGWLYLPSNFSKPGPIYINFHGGPEAQEIPSFRAMYQAILNVGIGIFAPNIRGSSGFGKRFVNLDNGPLRFNGIKDIKSCVDFLLENNIADPSKIGIGGGSYGGYMTMAGITFYPDMFAAAINLFGIVNFETFFENTEPWMAEISKVQYGDPDTQKDLLRDLSPIHKIDQVVTPTLVIHGANDTNCPVVEAEQVVNNLERNGTDVKFILFPDEGHGFRKLKNKITTYIEMTQWLQKYLKNL